MTKKLHIYLLLTFFSTMCEDASAISAGTVVVAAVAVDPHREWSYRFPTVWLPVRARVEYKISSLCYKALSSTAPPYLSQLLSPHTSDKTRSQDSLLLKVPRYKLETFGKKSFSVCAPTIWNALPLSLRHSNSLASFKKHLKTHLFKKYLN